MIPSGYVITKANEIKGNNNTRVYTKYANQDNSKKVELGKRSFDTGSELDDKTLNTLAFKYFRFPKRNKDA